MTVRLLTSGGEKQTLPSNPRKYVLPPREQARNSNMNPIKPLNQGVGSFFLAAGYKHLMLGGHTSSTDATQLCRGGSDTATDSTYTRRPICASVEL